MGRGIADHPDFPQLLRRTATIAARGDSLQDVVFRCVEPTYANEKDLLTGEGSRKYGGRWNPPHSFATVYTAFSDTTALAESKTNHLYYGWDPVDVLPRVIVAIDVKFAAILDLTNPTVRKTLGVSATRMRTDDWRAMNKHGNESLTQAIGRSSYESGLEGLITPACDGATNLIWFPGNLQGRSKTAIRNVKELR